MKGSTPKKEEKKAKEKPAEKKEASGSKKPEKVKSKLGGSLVVPYSKHPCKKLHPYQDSLYGGRVANLCKNGSSDVLIRRCTVCGEKF